MLTELKKEQLICDALNTDRGVLGDVTTDALVEMGTMAKAELVVKADEGVISGLNIFKDIFAVVDPRGLKVEIKLKDGCVVKKGDVAATVEGFAREILSSERVVLEFVRRMSGIATRTAEFVKEVEGTGAQILDTRKIMPIFGELDKQAVRDGGGTNHRMNLSEMGLIKNNHIDLLGSITKAVEKFRESFPDIPLEVEVRNEEELIEALTMTPQRIMLDNMTNEETVAAVELRNKFAEMTGFRIPLEASGNMTLDRVRSVAETGVDFISVGELTHSVKALDLSLHINIQKK